MPPEMCQTAADPSCYTRQRFRKYLTVVPNIDSVRSFDAIKILADPRRLEILRLLMAAPATLTQLGRRLKRSPAWIRHHLTALQAAGLGATA